MAAIIVTILLYTISVCPALLFALALSRSVQLARYRWRELALYKKYPPGALRFWRRFLTVAGLICACAALLTTNIIYISAPLSALSLAAFILVFAKFKPDYKVKLRVTPRIKRLIALFLTLYSALCFALAYYCGFGYAATAFVLSPVAFFAAFLIQKPLESMRNARFVARAAKKLAVRTDLIKIGITGSYGKTSVKEILVKMLEGRYKVLKTEGNFNTEMGIALTLNRLTADTEIFVAEMGARRVGDIAALCAIVKPDYGIVTGVAAQHLETFGTVNNIAAEKGILAQKATKAVVLNIDNPYTARMQSRAQKLYAGFAEGAFARATEIVVGAGGSEFCLEIDGNKQKTSTKLLARHNISNILSAAALAYKLGIGIDKIAAVITALQPVPHRLQLINTDNGVTVIDDGYNANLEGVLSALSLLKEFVGRKIVLAQGVVELGREASEVNRRIGAAIADAADFALIAGENTEYLLKGLRQKGYPEEQIRIYRGLREAEADFPMLLKRGDVLLLQNDLIE